MLKFLSITNLAVIENLQIDFKENLNAISGETGAGKSILIDALALLLGARAATDLIRTGEQRALVEGFFELSARSLEKLRSVLGNYEIELEDEKLFVRRELHVAGRSRLFINDQIANLATLKAIAPLLVEIHGQGEQYALGAAQAQMEFLDEFADCRNLRVEIAGVYARWKRAWRTLDGFRRKVSEHARAGEVLAYQLQELETIAPRPGEDEELTAEKVLLANAEKAFELSTNAYAGLYESDDNVIERLSLIKRRVQDLAFIDPRVNGDLEIIEAAILSLTDTAESLRKFNERIDFSPARLDRIEERLAELEKLKRRYNLGLSEIVELKSDLQQRLAEMIDVSGRMEMYRAELAESVQDYRRVAAKLTARRREAAPILEKRIESELAAVAMERT
ncbi:MAG: AAA family ATPase, partial [Pyrinomonadaceae bacterium]|nr:AAA family ATPase [Pyrinomonadaceae bacterium]